jgi:hypothetical protein
MTIASLAKEWNSMLQRIALVAWIGGSLASMASARPVSAQPLSPQPSASQPGAPQQPALEQPAPRHEAALADQVREAAKNYRPITPQEVASAQAGAARALASLDNFLRTGAPYKQEGWKRYLRWDELVAAVNSGQPADDVVSSVVEKLRADKGGLDLPVFVQTREALEQYASITTAARETNAAEEFGRKMDDLAKQIDAYAKEPTDSDAAMAIERDLRWLERHHQVPQLIAAVRRAYRPNLFGYVSRRLAAVGIERPVDQVVSVSDNILGTQLHGTARMVGQTTLLLNENPSAASLDVVLGGTVWSNNVGYNGPVTVYTTGTTTVTADKQVIATADGIQAYAARAGARTASSINGICANLGIIERIAWRKAMEQKGQAEEIGSQHAAARVAAQMNYEVGQPLAQENARYQEKIRSPLLRLGQFPENMTLSTRVDRLEMRMLKDGPAMPAAPSSPTGYSEDHDLAIRAHESVIVNYTQGLISGYEMTDVRLEKLIRDDLKAELPEELKVTLPNGELDPEKEPWSITFARDLPVLVKFRDGKIWIAVRADGFTRGEGDEPGKYRPALSELVEISATYTIQKRDNAATLRREGDVQVRFPSRANPEQVNLRDRPTVTFMQRKFRSLFKEEFVGEGLQFKGEWARAGRLGLEQIQSNNAWLVLGWGMPLSGAAPASAE